MKRIWIILIGIIFFFTSCTSYDYGPPFSFRSAESRISGTWSLENVLLDDIHNSTVYEFEKDYLLEFAEDGTFIRTKISRDKAVYSITGIWYFDDNKTHIITEHTETSSDLVETKYEILRLTNNELWVIVINSSIRNQEHRPEKRYSKLK